MRRAFSRADEGGFLAALLVLVLVLAAIAFAVAWAVDELPGSTNGCDVPAPRGAAIEAAPDDSGVTDSADGARRTVAYEVQTGAHRRADLAICARVGDVLVKASGDGALRVTFTITSDGMGDRSAVRETSVQADFASSGEALAASAWIEKQGVRSSWIFVRQPARVNVEVQAPPGFTVDVEALTDVGNLGVEDLTLGNATLETNVGDVGAAALGGVARLVARANVGDVDVEISRASSGSVRAETDVGEARVRVPSDAAQGVDVTAETDVGDVHVAIGPTDSFDRDERTPGETVRARSEDYASKPAKLDVLARADVGDVTVST